LKTNIDPLPLALELGFGAVQGVFNPKELLEELGVTHGEELRRRQKILSPAHSNFLTTRKNKKDVPRSQTASAKRLRWLCCCIRR
jgi:hypothetical protein